MPEGSYIKIKPIIQKKLEESNQYFVDNHCPTAILSDDEQDEIQSRILSVFGELEKFPLNGDLDTLVQNMRSFYNCCDQLYEKMGGRKARSAVTRNFLQKQIQKIESFANSGSYEELEIPSTIEKAVDLLVSESCFYQRCLRYG
jgi:hypothetical protein